jgi:hypothetical protein
MFPRIRVRRRIRKRTQGTPMQVMTIAQIVPHSAAVGIQNET